MITLSQSELDVNNNYNLNIANRIPDEYAIFPYIMLLKYSQ